MTPITRSRIVPNRWRSGPERSSSRHSASVGSPGGSSESRCPCGARRAWRADSRRPPSTMHVRSPGSCSTIPGSESLGMSRPARVGGRDTGRAPRRRAAASGTACPGSRARAGRTPARTRCIASRSASLNISGIAHALSVPTPCSPVIEPPASTHASRMRPASSSRAFGLALDARVVEHERVEVAVAGVKDVADAKAVLARELVDSPQHLGEPRARHDAVLHVVVGADPAHRGERRLSPPPDRGAVGRVGREPDLDGAGVRGRAPRRAPDRAPPARRGRRARRSARRRSRADSRLRRRPPPLRS